MICNLFVPTNRCCTMNKLWINIRKKVLWTRVLNLNSRLGILAYSRGSKSERVWISDGPDLSKSEQKKLLSSLDHFIYIKEKLLYLKWPRLAAILFKIAAILFVPILNSRDHSYKWTTEVYRVLNARKQNILKGNMKTFRIRMAFGIQSSDFEPRL